MEARNRKIEEWFQWIADGAVVLPRFQRYEAWGWWQVEGLLESVLRRPALPVGALLMLEVGDEPPFVARPIVGAPEGGKAFYHLLDGQQRMTALWRSMSGDYENYAFFVDLKELEQPDVITHRRYEKAGKLYPVWCDDNSEVALRNLVPIALLRPGQSAADQAKVWIKEASQGDMDRAMDLNEAITELRSRVSNYSLPFLSLPASTSRETALDVFIRMNTQGTALTAFDIVVAQVEADTGTSLHERVEGLTALVPTLSRYGDPHEIALAVGAVLHGRPPNRATFLRPKFGTELVEVWGRIEQGLKRAVAFLADEMIVNHAILPSDPLVTLMGAYWADAPEGKDAEGSARRLARQAFWRGAFTERYQKTSATRTAQDYRELIAYRDRGGPLPILLNQDETPLPEAAALLTGGWPKTKDRLGRAILATSLRTGGYDFADEQRFSSMSQEGREYHHLFPKARLEEEERPRRQIFCALNCALVSWRTNRTIGAKPPSVYVAERADEVGLPKEEVDRRLRSHCVPPVALRSDDFDAFLNARSALVHHIMTRLCEGHDVGLQDVVEISADAVEEA
ncbi:DUF262 domain-containing protein [Pseudophaeobacter sp.]|uniref:DUF262 domain-containing protein n=1 Tax=Pseudophaeobacter sp. TaxID=1971739 RepID=UPI002627709A|nr:DUF262 domain-containing protein [Pseudophaeobacter sp.]